MNMKQTLLALPLCAGLMVAQQATPQPEHTSPSTTGGKKMMGVLVSAKCTKMPKTTASSAADQTMPDQTTKGKAGEVTDSTRAADMNRDRARDVNQGTGTDAQLERTKTMDQTRGTADRASTPANRQDTNAAANPENDKPGELSDSSTWDRSCFISATTNEFMLHTNDGRFLKFDSAANSQIKSQLESKGRVATRAKIFRARVNGSVENDTIRLTDIEM